MFQRVFSALFLSLFFGVVFGASAHAEASVCQFTCLRYVNVVGTCVDYSRRPGPGYIFAAEQHTQTFSNAAACSAGTACQAACRSRCPLGPINSGSTALPSEGETAAFCILGGPPSTAPGPLYSLADACPGGSSAALTVMTRSSAWTAPHCVEAPTTPAGTGTSGTCNAPAVPENAPPKKCVFFCMQPGTGTTGSGLATSETGETGGALIRGVGGRGSVETTPVTSCLNVNVVRHVGTHACSSDGECACVDECKSVCGSEGGKSRCFIAPNSPDQISACAGAGNIGQARAPTCTPDDQTATGSPATLENPLNTNDIGELIARFIRAVSGIAGSMALLMFVVGGVMWMTAEGSDRVKTAQTILKNASLGLILIFFAYSIVSLFLSVLGL